MMFYLKRFPDNTFEFCSEASANYKVYVIPSKNQVLIFRRDDLIEGFNTELTATNEFSTGYHRLCKWLKEEFHNMLVTIGISFELSKS